MTQILTAQKAAERAATAERILIGGCTAEPTAILDAVAANPDLWRGRCLTGAFIPGVNNRDLSALGHKTVVETVFVTPGLREDRALGTVAHLPMHYSAFWTRLARPGVVDLVIVTVPPPRPDGSIGLGLTHDFAPAAIAAGARLIGIINPNMPDPIGSPSLPRNRFEALAESDAPLPELHSDSFDATNQTIARHVLEQMPKGSTLQLGLGKIHSAVLKALNEAKRYDVGYHAGMISDGVLDWLDAGGFGPKTSGLSTGVALGTRDFYDRLSRATGLRYLPTSQTHTLHVLANIHSLIAVNTVVQLDLTGQANGEYVGGRQMSGQGGMVDFIRGARESKGGRAILALPATAQDGTTSRIVATLPERTPVSVSRADVDLVITEYGVADLREACIQARAEALIKIAAPQFRDHLANEWQHNQRRARS
jgi:acyl-CoA hydrolase